MKVSLPQIINTKKYSKTMCASRISVQYINFLQFYKGYFTNFYQMKILQFYTAFRGFLINFYFLPALEYKVFSKFKLIKSNAFNIFVKIPEFFQKPPF